MTEHERWSTIGGVIVPPRGLPSPDASGGTAKPGDFMPSLESPVPIWCTERSRTTDPPHGFARPASTQAPGMIGIVEYAERTASDGITVIGRVMGTGEVLDQSGRGRWFDLGLDRGTGDWWLTPEFDRDRAGIARLRSVNLTRERCSETSQRCKVLPFDLSTATVPASGSETWRRAHQELRGAPSPSLSHYRVTSRRLRIVDADAPAPTPSNYEAPVQIPGWNIADDQGDMVDKKQRTPPKLESGGIVSFVGAVTTGGIAPGMHIQYDEAGHLADAGYTRAADYALRQQPSIPIWLSHKGPALGVVEYLTRNDDLGLICVGRCRSADVLWFLRDGPWYLSGGEIGHVAKVDGWRRWSDVLIRELSLTQQPATVSTPPVQWFEVDVAESTPGSRPHPTGPWGRVWDAAADALRSFGHRHRNATMIVDLDDNGTVKRGPQARPVFSTALGVHSVNARVCSRGGA